MGPTDPIRRNERTVSTGSFTATSRRSSRRQDGPSTVTRAVGWLALVVYLALLALVTLTPVSGTEQTANYVPGASFSRYLSEGVENSLAIRQLGGNVVMFLPFGFVLPFAIAAARRVLVTVPLALLASAGIEIVQATRVEGRVFDIDDVLLNVVGALVGLLIHRLLVRR